MYVILNYSLFLQETYPHTPPVWFADSEDVTVTQSVEMLSNTTGLDNHVISQVGILVRELCKAQGLPEPTSDLERLSTALSGNSSANVNDSSSSSSKSASGSSSTTDNASSEDMDIEYEFDEEEEEDDDGKGHL